MTTPPSTVSPLLHAAGFQHGFYGRIGGVSEGDYASLNCSYSVGDDAARVAENLARVGKSLGLDADGLVTVSQVHGCAVVDADGAENIPLLRSIQADAVVGTAADHALSVRTADCVPVLVGCKATGMAAAIHAGWRGVVAEVIPATILRLIGKGARPDRMVAAIGPHIGVNAFEVSPEVAETLDAVAPNMGVVVTDLGHRPHVRLAGLVIAQLHRAGLAMSQIDDLEVCTYANSREFFSFRRDGKASGRQLSSIRPRPPLAG